MQISCVIFWVHWCLCCQKAMLYYHFFYFDPNTGAPNGVNHAEFFNESKPPCYYFLAKDYGHADMLQADGIMAILIRIMMKSGKGSKKSMRRAVGGIVVAFLKAYLEGQIDDLNEIVKSPNLAPIILDPVISIKD